MKMTEQSSFRTIYLGHVLLWHLLQRSNVYDYVAGYVGISIEANFIYLIINFDYWKMLFASIF